MAKLTITEKHQSFEPISRDRAPYTKGAASQDESHQGIEFYSSKKFQAVSKIDTNKVVSPEEYLLTENPEKIEFALRNIIKDFEVETVKFIGDFLCKKLEKTAISRNNPVQTSTDSFLGQYGLSIYESANQDATPIGLYTYGLSSSGTDMNVFYEERSLTDMDFTLPDGRSQRWTNTIYNFYHPVSLELLAFSSKFEVKEGYLIKERILYNGIKNGDSYIYVRMNKGSITSHRLKTKKIISLKPTILLQELACSDESTPKKTTEIGIDIGTAGIEVVQYTVSSKKRRDGNLYVNIESDNDQEEIVYNNKGRIISIKSSGFTMRSSEYENKTVTPSIPTVIRPLKHNNIFELEPNTLKSLKVKLEGLSLPSEMAGRYSIKSEFQECPILTVTTEEEEALWDVGVQEVRMEKPNSYIQYDDARIQSAAKDLTKNTKTILKRVEIILNWIDQRVYDEYSLVGHNATDVFESPSGDCTEHTLLFLALTRAAGVNSRGVVGIVYSQEQGGFMAHQWAEVQFGERWVPVDPTFNQLIADPTHIPIAYSDKPAVEKVQRVFKKLSIEILEQHHRFNDPLQNKIKISR